MQKHLLSNLKSNFFVKFTETQPNMPEDHPTSVHVEPNKATDQSLRILQKVSPG